MGNDNPPEDLRARARRLVADGGIPDGDLLHDMLARQRVFHQRLVDAHPERWGGTADVLKEQVVMLVAEAVELLNWLPWKRHKEEYQRALTQEERDAAVEEVVDILHFVLNCFHVLGVTSGREIYALYRAKHAINNERQDGGY